MAIGVVGRKAGMTRITEDGASIPVTVIEVEPNRVTQVKTDETDGYRALQVTVGKRRASRVIKPMAGHFTKAGVESGRGLWEFRLDEGEGADINVGSEVKVFDHSLHRLRRCLRLTFLGMVNRHCRDHGYAA